MARHAVAGGGVSRVSCVADTGITIKNGVGSATEALVGSGAVTGVAGIIARRAGSWIAKTSEVANTGKVRKQIGVCWATETVVC